MHPIFDIASFHRDHTSRPRRKTQAGVFFAAERKVQSSMKRFSKCLIRFFFTIILFYLTSCDSLARQINGGSNPAPPETLNGPIIFRSQWKGSERWVGPEWWANPLTDWKIDAGSAVGLAALDRTLCYLPAEIKNTGRGFSMRVSMRPIHAPTRSYVSSGVLGGFRIGRKGKFNDFRSSAVYGYKFIDAVIRSDGRIIIGNQISGALPSLTETGEVILTLVAKRLGTFTELILYASQGDKNSAFSALFPTGSITGGLSLISNGPYKYLISTNQIFLAFRDFELSGDMIQKYPDRTFGPILWTQYTMSDRSVRVQAQLAPLNFPTSLTFWISTAPGVWTQKAFAAVDAPSRTALFTIPGWTYDKDIPYEVRMLWKGQKYSWFGAIRREPGPFAPLKIACFSCDDGYLFPLSTMVSQVLNQDPDMLYFAGDQIYETHGGFEHIIEGPLDLLLLDFLNKHYLFGWTWRELLKNRPSIILPDDHDVYQGNLFGHGGRQLPKLNPIQWEAGGYLMPGKWVSASEKVNAGHLPKPAVDITLPLGIKPYYTSLTYSGMGFAILEDRKFKTGPMTLPIAQKYSGVGAELLGAAQENFLKNWASNWQKDIMKCAFSQTMFANAATHQGETLGKVNYYLDSGAWPLAARNRVVRVLGDNNVVSLHGDQHLGMLVKHGVENFDDAGYAFMVPGTANGFPRAWWPGVGNGEVPKPGQLFTGKYKEGAGHPLNVLAVANPFPGSNLLQLDKTDPLVVGRRKGSGYGIVVFDKQNKRATFNMYRVGARPAQFQGFPKTVYIGGNPKDS